MNNHVKRKIAIFGTGYIARLLMDYSVRDGVIVSCFFDNDSTKYGKKFLGKYEVLSPDDEQLKQVEYIVIAVDKYKWDIYSQLLSLGIMREVIVCPNWSDIEYTNSILDVFFDIPKSSLKLELFHLKTEINYIRQALGRIEQRQLEKCNDIRNSEFKVYSQFGEDGIIQYLVSNVQIPKKVFVEFGVQNYEESNTRWLMLNHNWSGLVMDGDEKNIGFIKKDNIYGLHNLKAVHAFITAENINGLLNENGISGEIGLLSIDIDGNDYWVWKAINNINPAIVICEYNHRFGRERAVTIPYDPGFIRQNAHYSMIYFGASLRALVLLGKHKGYSLVAVNKSGNDAFFVRSDLLNERVSEVDIDDVFVHGLYRESRDKNGEMNYMSFEEEQLILNNMPLIEVD